jgi:RNA polymerase sigma-70 factor (ECF subfamily)
LYTSDEALIKKALKCDSAAEHSLFNRYAPKMLSVCRYYISDLHYAEDVMITSFTKVFDNLEKFRFEGNFEGWIRRIMVRESISFLRSRKQIYFAEIEEAEKHCIEAPESDYDTETLQLLIDGLPDGYRTVLILFAIESYNHKEIAALLGISESTSKSQLFKARKLLQQQLELLRKKENGRV